MATDTDNIISATIKCCVCGEEYWVTVLESQEIETDWVCPDCRRAHPDEKYPISLISTEEGEIE